MMHKSLCINTTSWLFLIGISSQWYGFKTMFSEKQWLEASSEDANSSHQEAQNSRASDEAQSLEIAFSQRVTSSCEDLELALTFRCLLRFTPYIYGCKNTKIIVAAGQSCFCSQISYSLKYCFFPYQPLQLRVRNDSFR